MRHFFLLAAMLIATAMPAVSSAQLDRLFDNKPSNSSEQSSSEINLDELQRMLSANYSTLERDGDMFHIEVASGDVTFPVAIWPAPNKSMLWLRVGLIEIPDNPGDHADKLLNLLELSGTHGHPFYSYNSGTRLLELFSLIDAEVLNEETLKFRIDNIIGQATDQYDAWNTDQWTNARHVGAWSAKLDSGQMTINLRGDGSFDLTSNSDGSVTQINGKYELASGTLTMKDAGGNEIVGSFRFLDGNHFELNVANQALNFERS